MITTHNLRNIAMFTLPTYCHSLYLYIALRSHMSKILHEIETSWPSKSIPTSLTLSRLWILFGSKSSEQSVLYIPSEHHETLTGMTCFPNSTFSNHTWFFHKSTVFIKQFRLECKIMLNSKTFHMSGKPIV